jgi:hypothetical protein
MKRELQPESQSEQSVLYKSVVRFAKGAASGVISGGLMQPL